MNRIGLSIGRWYVGFGIFLILCGVAGYASNPEHAKTALLSGGTFGTLSAVLGIWMHKQDSRLPRMLAGGTTLMLIGAFAWRSVVTWQKVGDGEPKRFAASLITLMLVASIVSLCRLWRSTARA